MNNKSEIKELVYMLKGMFVYVVGLVFAHIVVKIQEHNGVSHCHLFFSVG